MDDEEAAARFGPLVATSIAIRALFDRALVIAKENDGHLLIRGELGVGKRALARAIHDASPRRDGPFVVVDCRAIPGLIMGRALFGFQQTSIVGRDMSRPSPFEGADGGTLLLIEPTVLPNLGMQRALARVIREQNVRREGDGTVRPFRTTVIATTQRDLDEMYNHDLLAAELLGELSGATLTIPPLREHREDIGAMLASFLAKPELATPDLVSRLSKLHWPRNVEQLRALSFAMAAGKFNNPIDGVNAAVAEAELLDAIELDRADDALRHVYGDLLAGRGDPRGELIHVQCRLALLAHAPSEEREKLETIEARLLATYRVGWEAAVREAAAIFESSRADVEVTWHRGFMVGVRTTTDVLTRLDLLFEKAPLLTALELIPRARDDLTSQEIPFNLMTSPLLQRLRTLKITFPRLTDAVINVVASAWDLAKLDELEMSGPGSGAVARLEATDRFANDSQVPGQALGSLDPIDEEEAKAVLLASPYLESVRMITVNGTRVR